MKRILLVAAIILLTCCVSQEKTQDDRIGIIVSIPPQKEFAEAIGGDRIKVSVMVPPGADPHTYEPTPGQLVDVSRADAYFKVGSGIEFEISWMDKIAALNREMRIVDCSKGINLIPSENGHEEGDDPHIWTSVRNAEAMVENMYEALVEMDPANAGYYKDNRDAYIAKLRALDAGIFASLNGDKEIIVYHPSWAYFCRDYNLTQKAIESEGKEPGPRDIAAIIDAAKENNISVVFASPQFSTHSAEAIASGINGRVVLVDPLAEDYLENMRNVASAFKQENS